MQSSNQSIVYMIKEAYVYKIQIYRPACHAFLCREWTWRQRILPSRACSWAPELRTLLHSCSWTTSRLYARCSVMVRWIWWCRADALRWSDARSSSLPSRMPWPTIEDWQTTQLNRRTRSIHSICLHTAKTRPLYRSS